MRILLDTNILFSLSILESNYIKDYVWPLFNSSPEINVFICSKTIDELFNLMFKKSFIKKIKNKVINKGDKRDISKQYSNLFEKLFLDKIINSLFRNDYTILINKPLINQYHFVRDPNDSYLINTALSNGMDIVLTGDDDLLSLGKINNTHFLSPKSLYQSLNQTTIH